VSTSTVWVRRVLALGSLLGAIYLSGCSAAPTPASPSVTAPAASDPAPTPEPPAPTAIPAVPTPLPPPPTAVPTVVPTTPPTAVPTVAPTTVPTPIPVAPTAVPIAKPLPAEPVSISIPRFGASADILPMAFEADGVTMAAPTDPDIIGWYEFSAKVGMPGNAVVVGHVDWAGQLRAFGKLRQMQAGDVVELSDSLDRKLSYRVTSVDVVPYTTPPAEFLTQSGPFEELTLITCGGTFDKATKNYLSRVIVRAVRDAESGPQASASAHE
jgi:LPXTG-site transpeptidase (sortase) family protein